MSRFFIFLSLTAVFYGCVATNQGGSVAKTILPKRTGMMRLDLGYTGHPLYMKVYYHCPETSDANARVVIVMHGMRRNARDYRDAWKDAAEKYGCIVVAPEFDKDRFHGYWRYNMGNLYTSSGKKRANEKSAFAVVERLFDTLRKTYDLHTPTYYLFGHSAGGQFAHRMVLFGQAGHAEQVIAANAGAYTMPDDTIDLPYGTKGLGLGTAHYKRVYQTNLMIMVGEKDNNPDHRMLNTSTQAMAQGKHRLERGQTFYRATRSHAQSLGLSYNWQFRTIPGVPHSYIRMSRAAAAFFFGNT